MKCVICYGDEINVMEVKEEDLSMSTTVRAMYINGIFKPLEAFPFPEGKEVTITIDELSIAHKPGDGLEASAGGWKGLIDAEQFKKAIYESRQIQTRPEVKL